MTDQIYLGKDKDGQIFTLDMIGNGKMVVRFIATGECHIRFRLNTPKDYCVYAMQEGYYNYGIPPFILPYKVASPEERGKWPLIAAAIRCGDTVYAGLRHNVPYKYLLGFPDKRDILAAIDTEDREGFVDMNGCFYNRWQSARVADWQRQTDKMQDLLISEELWHDDFTPKHGPWRERSYV